MSSKPIFITFTGADDQTDYQDMVELGRMYPVEFGILLSPARVGHARYPSMDWVAGLRDHASKMHLSAHICGGYARHCMAKGTLGWSLAPVFSDVHFDRMQVNGHIDEVNYVRLVELSKAARCNLILQSRGAVCFPVMEGVSWLFDNSGGNGIEPTEWPTQIRDDIMVGYAGGLNPDNIARHAEMIKRNATNYWLDMESGVRDERDHFSINKCEAVCRAVYGEPQ